MSVPTQTVTRQVKPLLSLSRAEARVRVLKLYKLWIRQVPFILNDYDIPKSNDQLKAKIREEFLKNSTVKDLRAIDMLVIKGQMDLKETTEKFKHSGIVMSYFKETQEPKPKDFLSKFLAGNDP